MRKHRFLELRRGLFCAGIGTSLLTLGLLSAQGNDQIPDIVSLQDPPEMLIELEPFSKKEALHMDMSALAKRIIETSLDIQLADTDVDVARTEKNEALGQFLPNILGSYRQSRFVGGVQVFDGEPARALITNIQPEVRATWDLSLGGKEFFAASAMKHHLKEASWEKQQVVLTSLKSAAVAYFEYLEALQEKDLSQKGVLEAKTVVGMQEERFKEGVGVKLDVLDAHTQLNNRNLELLQSEKSIYQTNYDLLTALRYPLASRVEPANQVLEPLTWFKDMPETVVLVKQGLNDRPDLKAAQANIDAARAEYKTEWASAFPNIKLTSYLNGIGRRTADLMTSRFAGFEITTDLLSHMGVEQYQQIKRAQAKLRKSELTFEKQLLDAKNVISQSYLDVKVAATRMDVSKDALDVAEAAYEQAVGRLEHGLGDHVEVAAAMRNLSEARIRWSKSVLSYNVSQIDLANQIGTLDNYMLP